MGKFISPGIAKKMNIEGSGHLAASFLFSGQISSDKISPRIHHGSTLVQQVSTVVSSFYLVLDKMRERSFCQVPGVALLTAPVAKAGTKAMSRG